MSDALRNNLQYVEKGFLRNVYFADALHAALTFFLFFQQFAFTRDIAAVALGENILADGGDGLPRDHSIANRRLNGNFKHLAWNEFLHFFDQRFSPRIGEIPMNDPG